MFFRSLNNFMVLRSRPCGLRKPLAGLLLGARSLPRQLIGVPRQCRHIVRVDPALPLHAACSKLAGLAVGLALGCCLGGGQKRTVRNTSKPRVVLRT